MIISAKHRQKKNFNLMLIQPFAWFVCCICRLPLS